MLAANTAFNGFPVLGSILARDGYLPRQLHTRGDRLAYSNGIILLAAFAIVLIVAFDAEVTRLIQLYIVGVFVSFTVSQTGMVRHWTRLLRTERDPGPRRRMQRSRVINAIGLDDDRHRARRRADHQVRARRLDRASLAMVVIFVLMRASTATTARSRRARDRLGRRGHGRCPSRIHAHRAGLASSTSRRCGRSPTPGRPGRDLEAVTVDVDPEETERLLQDWEPRDIPVPLKVLASPYREVTRPVIDYVTQHPPARARATSSPSTSPSTSSGTGGSRSCTTRARCGSRAGCCSPRA